MNHYSLPPELLDLIGPRIGVAAPGSAPLEAEAIRRGLQYLKGLGLQPVLFRDEFEPDGYLCGSDADRADELNFFLRDPDIRVVFCIRGGYGSLRILPLLDYQAAATNPTLVVGYSDITAVQLALLAISGVPSVSGPMISVEFAGDAASEQDSFWKLLAGETTELRPPVGCGSLSGFRDGSATGRLVGGNLAVFARLIGTPFMPELDDAILFLEDVGESPYRIDGMFAHLANAGILDRVAGVILGRFTDADAPEGKPSLTFDRIIADYFGSARIPVATNLCYGHFPVKNALPIGVRAQLTVTGESASLTLLDSVWSRLNRPA